MKLVSNSIPQLTNEENDMFPGGSLSKNAFPLQANPIDVVDPKLGFSNRFQVFDEGKLWQWEFAEFKTVPGRGFGEWVSTKFLTVFSSIIKYFKSSF